MLATFILLFNHPLETSARLFNNSYIIDYLSLFMKALTLIACIFVMLSSFNYIKLIGINNRDLTNGKTDLGISRRLIPMALQEKNKVRVCESGIYGRNEIEEFEALGVKAFLIGASLMPAQNIPETLKELLGDDSF